MVEKNSNILFFHSLEFWCLSLTLLYLKHLCQYYVYTVTTIRDTYLTSKVTISLTVYIKSKTIETNLPRNDHWKVLYKICVFYVDRKSKMAATTIHRLTLDPMGKCSNELSPAVATILNFIPEQKTWSL
jgi:hypothetical protein